MIHIINTILQIDTLFDNRIFSIEKWELYINSIYESSSHIFKEDLQEYLDSGDYTFEKDFEPIINAVCKNPSLEKRSNPFLR